MIYLNVPGLPVDWLVIEDDKLVCLSGEDFSLCFSVVEGGDASVLDSDRKLAILQHKDARRGLFDSDKLFLL